jgi:DNA polymerase-1
MATQASSFDGNVLHLVDISSFIFRAYYAIRSLNAPSGEPVNAVFGVASMMGKLIEDAKPVHLVVAYDSKEPSFRKEMFVEYKANRSAPPEELVPQFDRIEQLVRVMGIPAFRKAGVEADDLIATVTKRWLEESPSHEVVIVTGDKDLMQLVNDRVRIWDTMNNRIYRHDQVVEKFGVGPEQVRDWLALVGDSSDNIPGVEGIGPKGATDLLKAHGSLEGILKAAADGQISGKKGQVLKEQVDVARLSAKLASLVENVPLDGLDPGKFTYQFEVKPECASFLQELGFHSLLRKWGGEGKDATPLQVKESQAASSLGRASVENVALTADGETAPMQVGAWSGPKPEFKTVLTVSQLEQVISEIQARGEFAFDIETTSLNPRLAEPVGFAICTSDHEAWYIPVGHRARLDGPQVTQLPFEQVVQALKPWLENPRCKKIGQNLKYDFSVLEEMGLKPDGIGADTMVAAYVLDPEGRHSLDVLAQKYMGYAVLTYEEVCGKGKDEISFDAVAIDIATRYSAEDAWVAWQLWKILRQKLNAEKLMPIFAEVDLPLVKVLGHMERTGVHVDVQWLQKLSREFDQELKAIEAKIAAFTQGPVNLNSPKQLAHLLFEELKLPVQSKTKTGYSTDASVLEALAPLHEVPKLLLEYREISKLKGTYVDPIPQMLDPKDRKIHTSFRQTGTATGRLSSSDPNLQNIPIRSDRGRKIRRAFVPSQGCVLLSADYSQIELRLLAHMSGDKELCASFNRDEDVHRRTAAEIFSLSPEQVDDRQRGIAKAINFGLMYGKTPFGLSQELHISRKEAQETIDRYFERYSGVKRFLDRQIVEAREKGFCQTLLGRKRPLPNITSRNAAIRANAERMAMNAPIQGTAADLMKLAMIELDHELEKQGYRSKLIVQVHDEVLLDCPRAEAEAVQVLTVKVLENAMKLDIPLRVNAALGENWMEI